MKSLSSCFILAVVLMGFVSTQTVNAANSCSNSNNIEEVIMSRLPPVIAEPFTAGERAFIFTGNLSDYEMVNGKLVYRLAYYKDSLFTGGKINLSLSKATSPKIYRHQDLPAERKRAVEGYLKQLKLFPLPPGSELEDQEKLRDFLRKLRLLLVAPAPGTLSFVVHLDYLEHFVSCGPPGMELPDQLIWMEFLHGLAISPALKNNPSQNAIICSQYEGPVPTKLKDFFEIELPFPDAEQTAAFIKFIVNRNGYAKLDPDLSEERLQSLVRGLPFKSTERMFRHAAVQKKALDQASVVRAKAESIIKISEGTLSLERSGELTSFDQLIGMQVVKQVLTIVAGLLRRGRPAGRSICLVGPPGTGKSVMIALVAHLASYICIKFEQVKDRLVGESERRLRKAISLIRALGQLILWIDEVDKSVPNQYQGMADGGVSSDQLAQLQQFLARDELRHEGIFIMATSNAPQFLGTALQDRFVFLPVLGIIPDEIPELLRSYVPRLKGTLIDDDREVLLEAGQSLYLQGASPRQMLDIIQHCINLNGPEVSCENIARAAADFSGQTDPAGVQAAILQSIRMCSFKSWLPWAGNPHYPLPSCLEGIVNVEENTVDYEKLNEKLTELMPYAQL